MRSADRPSGIDLQFHEAIPFRRTAVNFACGVEKRQCFRLKPTTARTSLNNRAAREDRYHRNTVDAVLRRFLACANQAHERSLSCWLALSCSGSFFTFA